MRKEFLELFDFSNTEDDAMPRIIEEDLCISDSLIIPALLAMSLVSSVQYHETKRNDSHWNRNAYSQLTRVFGRQHRILTLRFFRGSAPPGRQGMPPPELVCLCDPPEEKGGCSSHALNSRNLVPCNRYELLSA